LTSQQAQQLEVRSHTQLSPYLEICCLGVSANVAYEQAANEIACFTGVQVPRSVQQRLVHRQEFPKPVVEAEVKQLSADGGNIHLREEPCTWQGYKAVCLHELAVAAACEDNPQLIEWV
jgi:hypothetical protein